MVATKQTVIPAPEGALAGSMAAEVLAPTLVGRMRRLNWVLPALAVVAVLVAATTWLLITLT